MSIELQSAARPANRVTEVENWRVVEAEGDHVRG